jgi:hypothetical protein
LDNIKTNIKLNVISLYEWRVDGTESGFCQMAGFNISIVETSGSATMMLVNYDNVHLLN